MGKQLVSFITRRNNDRMIMDSAKAGTVNVCCKLITVQTSSENKQSNYQ
jgi:hypothetical protein